MASFDSLVKEVLPYVPGCPDTLVENHLRSATIDFAERSKAYVLDLDPITTVSGVYEYDFDQPSGTEVHQILWMTYDGNDMDPISPRSLELNYPDWRDRTSRPHVYLQKTPSTFWVVPVPQQLLQSLSSSCEDFEYSGYLDRELRFPDGDGCLIKRLGGGLQYGAGHGCLCGFYSVDLSRCRA